MIKSNLKRNVSGSGKVDVLSDLQKQKEMILRDMEEQKRRKQRELERKQVKSVPMPTVVNEKHFKEKTPPVFKKPVRVEAKSFAEIMREAEQRSKQKPEISDLPLSKNSNIIKESSLPSIKRKISNSDVKSDKEFISNKKIKLNENKKNNDELKTRVLPINSLPKQNSITKPPATSHNINAYKLNSKSNEYDNNIVKHSKTDNAVTQSSSKNTKCGILAQSSKNGLPGSKCLPNQYSSKNSPAKQLQSINSKSNLNSIKHNEGKSNGLNIKSQSMNNCKSKVQVNSEVKNFADKKLVQNRRVLNKNQNVRSSDAPPRGISVKNGSNSSRGIAAQSAARGITAQSAARGITAQSAARGITSQSAARGITSQSAARGIAAQSAARGITAQNAARGIAAQSAARGILAQSGSGVGYISESDEEEYDSELDNFIDDTEYVVDDTIKKEIYKSLNFDPEKYTKVSKYDDCSNMVSRFDEICKEEIRSSKIGRQEDLLELRELEKATEKKMKSKYY